jgi:hypothetical protein
MKLYLLKRTGKGPGGEYDVADGFIVRAEDEQTAREIAAAPIGPILGGETEFPIRAWGDEGPETWLNPKFSTCEEIIPDGEPGIIIRDFNAA